MSDSDPRPRSLRPAPRIDELNRFFWEGAAEGKLLFQRCSECKRVRHPPSAACHTCRSFAWTLFESSGKGQLFSYGVPRRPRMPFNPEGTVFAVVELEEGLRLITNLVDVGYREIAIGAPVEVLFEARNAPRRLPLFRLSAQESGC